MSKILGVWAMVLLLASVPGVASAQFVNEDMPDANLANWARDHHEGDNTTLDTVTDIAGPGVRYEVSTDATTTGLWKIGIADDWPIDDGYGFPLWEAPTGQAGDWSTHTAYQLAFINNSSSDWVFVKGYYKTSWWTWNETASNWVAPGDTLVVTSYFGPGSGVTGLGQIGNFGFELSADYGTEDYEAIAFDVTVIAEVIPAPHEVWVDDGWTGYKDGQDAGGHIYDYDAFSSIQDGIAGVSGSTVNVANGTYTGPNTITNKSVTITGESETGVIVEAAASQTGTANTFTINASGYDVTLEKMTIRHGDYGIRSSAGNVDVLHCTIYHNGWDGTGLPGTPTQSTMETFYDDYATDGGAVRLENSAGSEVAYNTVYENDRGLRYQYGSNGNFHHNISHGNIQSGIYLTDHGAPGGCTNTQVHDNTVYGNMNNGILALRGNGNTITDNDVYDNWNTGIHMHGPSDFLVEGNTVTNNSVYAFNGEGNAGNSDGGIAAAGAETITATLYTLRVLGNTISGNNAGSHANSTGIWLGATPSLPADGINIENNVFTGHEIDIHILSQAATTTINWNGFSGSLYGVKNDDTSKATVNAENDWWGHEDGPTPSKAGVGVTGAVDYDPWIGKAGSENIVCDPDPQYLTNAVQTNTVDVNYLGGGSGLVYGYSVSVSWDASKVTMNSITEGSLLSDQGSTQFFPAGIGNSRTVDCVLLGDVDGVTGPGTMFTISYTGEGCGTDVVQLTIIKIRDKDNNALSGFYEDDGELVIDMVNPVFTVNGPAAGECYSIAPVLDLAATDACGNLDDAFYCVDGGGWMTEANLFTDDGTNSWANATWTLPGFDLLGEGSRTVDFYCTDEIGNTSATASWNFIKDTIDPPPATDFVAAPGNGKVHLSWTNPGSDFDHVVVVRKPWAAASPYGYPVYTQPADGYPTSPTDGTEVYSGTGESYEDSIAVASPPRSIYFYRAFTYDCADNFTGGTAPTGDLPDAFAQGDRSTNYWVGDVAGSMTPGLMDWDGCVHTEDLNSLSDAYWLTGGLPSPENECDVGPTDDNSR
ncbi:MAG: right-handed parallel beta-helix repeat-containing protein, partial [Candidatus Eisenbacteria sp.]|nr:right-handed parallel beta-helix repeat-containing protein [Candidatus Eisenbacteria bacterium]